MVFNPNLAMPTHGTAELIPLVQGVWRDGEKKRKLRRRRV